MTDDLFQTKLLVYKSMQSHKGLIPSINFNENEYSLYLKYASAAELEKDIVSEKTYRMIIAHDNWDDDEYIVDDKIRMRYF
jgi:uncharacterized protein YueI